MSRADAWITGVGLLTPLGSSAWATMRALLEGRTLTDRLGQLADEPIDGPTIIRGAGRIFDSQLGPGDPTATLALRALHEALGHAGLSVRHLIEMPIVVASSKGAIGSLFDPMTRDRAAAQGPHGYLCSLIQRQTSAPSCRAVVAACASGLFALDGALRLLRRGGAQRVAVVAVEASLLPLLMASYRRLGVLPPLTPSEYRCRPLDTRRAGFTLTEQAAAIIIDSQRPHRSPAASTSIPPMRILGVRTLNEAHHLIKPPRRDEVHEQLARWACAAGAINLVHPHATGTAENDEAELATLAAALESHAESTAAYAVKGAIGHGLGCAGLASLVIACLIARCGRIPPMPWLDSPLRSPLQLARNGQRGNYRRHAIFASGFGGHTAAAVIEADPG